LTLCGTPSSRRSTQVISPSPIIEVLLNDVRRDFPDSEKRKLTRYVEEIGRTTSLVG